jgi:hypothetical protein
MIPMYPELRCPVLCSENEEVEKRAHFLELPTGHQFPSKAQRTRGRGGQLASLSRDSTSLHLLSNGPLLSLLS